MMTLPLNQAVDTFEFTAAVLEFLSICASLSALELSLISPFALLSLAAPDLRTMRSRASEASVELG